MNILNKNNNKNWTSKKNNKNCKGITEINNNILTLLLCVRLIIKMLFVYRRKKICLK